MDDSVDLGIVVLDVRADFDAMGARLRAVGNQAPHVIRRAINRVGDKTRTQVVRALARQTGAKYGTIRRAMRYVRANYGRLDYRIVARGTFMPLSAFAARQTRAGVSAAPWGKRQLFRGAFIAASLGGGVYVREVKEGRRAGRLPIRQLYGPAIPRELLRDAVRETFERAAAAELVPAVEREVGALLAGFAPRG